MPTVRVLDSVVTERDDSVYIVTIRDGQWRMLSEGFPRQQLVYDDWRLWSQSTSLLFFLFAFPALILEKLRTGSERDTSGTGI
ncbi:MAG: hypothetical protein LBO79_02310 [Zoogloeaceae bacterium]|nr:hypothetical protein [Zoogloeaceae bacterium]